MQIISLCLQYLGNHTTEKVKKRCIELLYSWDHGLPHEAKIKEAYQMLKRQGIVKEDPVYIDKVIFLFSQEVDLHMGTLVIFQVSWQG